MLSEEVCRLQNILHLGKFYPPENGGIESVTKTVAEYSSALGHRVSVLAFSRQCRKFLVSDENGVSVYRAPINLNIGPQPISIVYVSQCIKLVRKADLVHLHAPNLLAMLFLLFARSEAKVLVHWHSDIVGRPVSGFFVGFLERAILRRATVIAATSQMYADSSKRLHKFKAKVQVVPLGVPDNVYLLSDSSFLDKEKKTAGKKIILSVGRLVPYKGHEYLIRAALDFPANVVVVIVGEGPLKKRLELLVAELGLRQKVVFFGGLSDSELRGLYARASLFCLPSINKAEAFGVVLLEAMSFGLPIVAANIPGSGVSWVNANGITGMNVRPGCPRELARACMALLHEPIGARLSKASRKRFEELFEVGRLCRKVEDIYTSMSRSG